MKKDDLNQETLKKKPVKKDDLNQETIKKKPVKKDDLKRMPEELPEKKDEPKSRNPKEKLKCLKCLLMIGVGLRANKSQSIHPHYRKINFTTSTLATPTIQPSR